MLLKTGALDGRAVAAGAASAAACAAAGATIVEPGARRIDTLVVDAGSLFGAGGIGGLRAALDGTSRASDDDLAARVAFLASAGGKSFLGCRFTLP